MWRWKSIAVAAAFLCADLMAQEYDSMEAIENLAGGSASEEMDEEEVERLERYIRHPLRINMGGTTKIRDSGLLTHYQIASLTDYRSRHGDILSLTELAAVDGFGQDLVRKLAPFISLESTADPGFRSFRQKRVSQELDLKGGLRHSEGTDASYALRYRIEVGECFQAGFAVSGSSGSLRPDALTGNAFWNFRRCAARLLIGDFNARFGQGLTLWNGMSLSGLNKPSSYLKRAASLSASASFTGNYAFRGIAAESMLGRFHLTALAAVTDADASMRLLPGANLSWLWKNGQIGLTHYLETQQLQTGGGVDDMKTSCDVALTVKGVDFFAETAYDWVSEAAASLMGTVFPIGEDVSMAAMLRYYPDSFNPSHSSSIRALTKCSNEYGTSVSSEFTAGRWVRKNGMEGFGSNVRRIEGTVCADAAYFPVSKSDDGSKSLQLRSLIELKLMLSEKTAIKLRVNERFRTWGKPLRTDARLEMFLYSLHWDATIRVNALKCDEISFLIYGEGCLKAKSLKAYLRAGVFCADSWDDRIYAYERDIPGTFNVPAFYGRGLWASFTGNWRFAPWGRVYARASLTEYFQTEKKKPGKAELKLMLKIDI